MTLTTHAAMGAVIGTASGNPLLGFLLSLLSHFLVDMIPHGDAKFSDNYRVHKRKQKQALAFVMTDAIVAIFFVLILASTKDLLNIQLFVWGIAGAVLPDLLVGLSELSRNRLLKRFFRFHFFFHDFVLRRKGDIPLSSSLLGQFVLILLLQSML